MNIKYICKNCGGQASWNQNTNQMCCENCGSQDFSYEVDGKCPICNSNLIYDENRNQIVCSYDHSHELMEFTYDSSDVQNEDLGTFESNTCECEGCGAEIILEPNTAATKCPYCGSNIQITQNIVGEAKPYGIIPFKFNRQEAEQAFQKWCKKGLVTPNRFKIGDRIKDIQPIFIPFWIYDVEGKGDIVFEATKVRTYTRGDYRYKETSYYHCFRNIDAFVEGLPCDASKKMEDDLMDRLEPFDLKELKDFNIGYLSGNLTEKYDYTNEELYNRACKRALNYMVDYASSTVVGYHSCRPINKNLNMKKQKAHYILLPIWTVFYNHDGKEYVFAMNGQTGKVVGKPPISKSKVLGYGAGIATILSILQYIIFFVI